MMYCNSIVEHFRPHEARFSLDEHLDVLGRRFAPRNQRGLSKSGQAV